MSAVVCKFTQYSPCGAFSSLTRIQTFNVTTQVVRDAKRRMIEDEAISCARAGQPLPAGYLLPQLSNETKLIYHALRAGEHEEVIAQVT